MITFVQVNKIVAKQFRISPKMIMSNNTTRPASEARHIAMWICKHYLDYSSNDLMQFYNKRNHSTPLNSIHRCQDLMDTDKAFRARVQLIEEKVMEKIDDLKEVKQRYNLHYRLREKDLRVNTKSKTVSLKPGEEDKIQNCQLSKLLKKHHYSVQYSID